MKEKKILLHFVLAIMVIFNSNCKKPIPEKKELPLTKIKMADANADISANFSLTTIMLNGRAKPFFPGEIIKSSNWKQIDGPSTASIESPTSLQTKVTNLQTGTYKFELTVYDDANHYGIDTMMLSIENSGTTIKQLLFSKMSWSTVEVSWSEFWLDIESFHTFIPPNTVFEIFIRREISPDWHQVIPIAQNTTNSGYVYTLSAGANPVLWISELPEVYNLDKADIKIVF